MDEYFLSTPIEEVMRTQLAMRRLKPDPIDDSLLLHFVDLAIRAPSGKNRQSWEFVFLKDREKIAQLAQLNRAPIRLVKPFLRDKEQPMVRGFLRQAKRFEETPVVCVPCVWSPLAVGPLIFSSSLFGSIYPAVQNLMLAARAAGVGTTLTTVSLWNVWRLRKIISAPWNLTPVCVIPMGWPEGEFRENTRRPASESFHIDGYRR